MNVLIVSGIFPPDIGGPATYVPMMAEGLLRRGFAPTVVTMGDAPASAAPEFPFPVHRISRRRGAVRRWAAGAAAVAAAARRADVVLAAGLLVQTAAAGLVVRRPLVVRAVSDLAWDRATAYGWIDHSLDEFHRRRHGLRVGALKTVQRWALRRADAVIVPSRWLAGWVTGEGVPSERIRVIPNAVTVPHRRPDPPRGNGMRMIAAVGRLVPVKRFDQIVRAVAAIPSLRLRIIGDGPERVPLERLALALGVSDRVEFAGRRDHAQAMDLLAECDGLVVGSAHEGFPHVVLEAMALHLPVIAASAGGIPELIDDGRTGLLVDGSVESITTALRRLKDAPELAARLGEQAGISVRTRFEPDAMIDATVGALHDAMRRRPA